VGVGVPVHVPVADESVWPSLAVPEIVGGDVFVGGSSVTTAVGALSWIAEPTPFVAVTRIRTVEPTSEPVRV
jgi:hypothetical protein